MFELLLSVSGVGAKSAIVILSNITPSSFALAVITDDVGKLKKLPGIGPKTAQRIILELKDKIKTEQSVEKQATESKAKLDEKAQDAIDALQVLRVGKTIALDKRHILRQTDAVDGRRLEGVAAYFLDGMVVRILEE